MNNIFKMWIYLTIGIILITTAVVAALSLITLINCQKQERLDQKKFIEKILFSEYSQIAEDFYLKLDSLAVRQKNIQEILGKKAELKLIYKINDSYNICKDEQEITWKKVNDNLDYLCVKLSFGSIALGYLYGSVSFPSFWQTEQALNLTTKLAAIVIILLLFWIFIFLFFRKKIFYPLVNEMISLQKNTAIAKTTQMLAHDVRKPFTMLEGLLSMFQNSADPAEIQQLSKNCLPDVQKAMCSVNSMIDEVMEIGRMMNLKQEPVSPESIIETSLSEICRMFQKADIDIVTHFNHRQMIHVDALKIQRIFSNILSNSFQAMNNKGTVWFSTVEDSKLSMTTFCIGNNGSFIPHSDLTKLFDAFYTKNKAGGTGLGLAIAQKIIVAHGGKIWCESSEKNQIVEFFFTLPVAKGKKNQKTTQLHRNTSEYIKAFKSNAAYQIDGVTDSKLSLFEKQIDTYTKNNERLLKIGIVEDEAFYRKALLALVQRSRVLKNSIDLCFYKNSAEVLESFEIDVPDFLICDIDLGPDSLNGFEIVKELRRQDYQQPIFIHSNRHLPEDYQRSNEVGAQALLPKPMTREHLIRLLATSLPTGGLSAPLIVQ